MKKITALFLSFLIAIAPVYQAHAIFPAIGSVVTAVVGATVVDAGTQAVVNVVAGKSPWGASDNVFGGKVKIPIKGISDWVKKKGLSFNFWGAALIAASLVIMGDTAYESPVSSDYTNGICSDHGYKSFAECVFVSLKYVRSAVASDAYVSEIRHSTSANKVIYYIDFYSPSKGKIVFTRGYSFPTSTPNDFPSTLKPISDSDFDKIVADSLSKVGYGDNPFTPNGSQYPVYPVDGQFWPTTVTPVTPPMNPEKPWPTPVPSPQPIPTPDSPTFPAVPDDAWKPFPLPDHTVVKPVDPPPVTNPGTEVKPTPDGGFIIPNPLPVTVEGPVDVNLLNIEQPLTAAQLAQRDLRIDNDSAAALGSPDVLSNDSYFDAFKPVNDMMNNLPSPPSFNFTAGMFGIPSYSSCIPYTFTIPSMGFGSMSIPSQNVTIGQHCAYYDANLRPFVAWLFQALALLTVYRIAVRSTRI